MPASRKRNAGACAPPARRHRPPPAAPAPPTLRPASGTARAARRSGASPAGTPPRVVRAAGEVPASRWRRRPEYLSLTLTRRRGEGRGRLVFPALRPPLPRAALYVEACPAHVLAMPLPILLLAWASPVLCAQWLIVGLQISSARGQRALRQFRHARSTSGSFNQ